MEVKKSLNDMKQAVQFLESNFAGQRPQVAITLGSGLGDFGQRIESAKSVSYTQIPHFLTPSVEGHEGQLIVGRLGQVPVVALKGRAHGYEGHSMSEICFATRVMGLWGAKTLVVTNASGGINSSYRPGHLVLIKDHLNLSGQNPLIGPNLSELGPRFPDMGQAYDPKLINHFQNVGRKLGRELNSGVYAWLNGPCYETPAEIRMLKVMGADLVGMSTVPEVIVARHMGMKVCGISCVTNLAAGLSDHPLNHEEVKQEAFKVRLFFSDLLAQAIASL